MWIITVIFKLNNEWSQLNSLTAYLKLINNFPEMKWASTDNLKWIDQENKTKSDELLNANKSSENLKNSLIKTCKSSRDQRELLNFEHKFISTEECESEANPHLTIKNEKVVIHSQNSGSKNNSKNKETENLKQQNGKSSGC